MCVHKWVVVIPENLAEMPSASCSKCHATPDVFCVTRNSDIGARVTLNGMRRNLGNKVKQVAFDCYHPLRALIVGLEGTTCRRCGSFKPHPLVLKKQRTGTGTHNRVETQA